MSPQLQQVLDQARQLSPQEQIQLADQLLGAAKPSDDIVEDFDDRPEAELEYVNGVLVVKTQQPGTLDLDLVEFINQQREERIRKVGGW